MDTLRKSLAISIVFLMIAHRCRMHERDMKALLDLVRRHKAGEPIGIFAVCSAHPLVIEAALRAGLCAGLESGRPMLIEATSNQVNQDGGYTGMTPVAFRAFVLNIAAQVGFPEQLVLLGGDHLGPNCWQALPAEQAMAKSEVLVAQYVEAGFRKIHLDCSMPCAGDASPLSDEVIAERAARLCAVAEQAWQRSGGEAPVYVVGTEVPVPGGAHEDLAELVVTRPAATAATLAAHRAAFAARQLSPVWQRVIGLVVQPGVEFDHDKVVDYRPEKAVALSRCIAVEPAMVFEAHSTDYQTPGQLSALVRDHFAILKVGPGVTHALRETLWALADIESTWIDAAQCSGFKEVVLRVMRREPVHWQKYYPANAHLTTALQFSLSDRIRYYWPHPEIQAAQARMLSNLNASPPPLTLLSQYLPGQYAAIRNGRLRNEPAELLLEGVARVLRQYIRACTPRAISEEISG